VIDVLKLPVVDRVAKIPSFDVNQVSLPTVMAHCE